MLDGTPINFTLIPDYISQDSEDNSLKFSKTQYYDSGSYACRASNGIDSTEASAQLVVKVNQSPPEMSTYMCCKARHFCEDNLCVFECDKILRNVFLRFLLLVYRQSIEQRNICALNFCDRRKIRRTKRFLFYSICQSKATHT